MLILRNSRRVCAFLVRTILRLTVYKLLWIFFSAVLFCIVIKIWINEQDAGLIIPLHDHSSKNISRVMVPETENPPIVWWNPGYRLTDETIECSNLHCDVFGAKYELKPNSEGAYLFYASRLDFKDLPLPRISRKIIWALSHEESPRNVAELLHEPGLNLFNISSTFSRHSDVSFPLQYMESLESITSKKYYVETTKKNELLKEISPLIFMSSNCFTFTDRDNYVKELVKYIPIDSYGECLNNKRWPEEFPKDHLNNFDNGAILNFVARYKFAIAIENGVCEDYVTEKFWRLIKLGVIPIYFGSPSITDWFPNNKSAILIEDFSSPKALSEHLYELLKDDNLYEQYLEHKTKEIISNRRLVEEMEARPYQTDISKTALEFECFVCKSLHDNIKKTQTRIVTKSHYNCSKPISALTKEPIASELPFWEFSKRNAELLYRQIESTQQH